MQKQCENDLSLRRSPENYESDLIINNHSLTGITERSIFNKIPNFHVTQNSAVDSMHDVAEGVCHLDMIFIINDCISCAYFTLDELNARITTYQYGHVDSSSKPPTILPSHLQNNRLKMSASQTLCFVKNFGLLIGDRVPNNANSWELYKLLRQILNVVLAKSISPSCPNLLRYLVQQHHKLYINLTKKNLTPKNHFLVHYADFMEEFGPVSQFTSFKHEAKHKYLKQSASVNKSRKNLAYSTAMKHQLHICHRVMSSSSIMHDVVMGPCHNLEQYERNEIAKSLSCTFENIDAARILSTSWVDFKGTKYRDNLAVLLNHNDESLPNFRLIINVLIHADTIIFHCIVLHTLRFDEHIIGYEVISTSENEYICVSDLVDPHPLTVNNSKDNKRYIILRSDV